MNRPLAPRQGLVAFLATLAGPEPAGLLELRPRRSGMRRRCFDARQPHAAAMAATVLSRTGDANVGWARRSERSGAKDAVRHGWVLWVGCDDPHAIAELKRFQPRPANVVRTSPHAVHARWPVERPLTCAGRERFGRVARVLGADPAGADAARILGRLSVAASTGAASCLFVSLRRRPQRTLKAVSALAGRRA